MFGCRTREVGIRRAVLLVLGVAFAATLLPAALRALRVDPMTTLRHE